MIERAAVYAGSFCGHPKSVHRDYRAMSKDQIECSKSQMASHTFSSGFSV